MNYTLFAQNRDVIVILLASAVIFIATWWPYPHIVESAHTRPELAEIQGLVAPSGFAAADEDSDTAFREGEAGFSAYYRVPAPSGTDEQDGSARLAVSGITDKLTNEPDETDEVRAGVGSSVDIGLNFGIVELPMFAAVVSPAPTESVTVYFDDQGWVVAYLPKGRPAAAIWKHKSVPDATGNEELENNLLVLAINEVLKADDANAAGVAHSDVAYYDWDNESCDAFALFSAVASAGASDPVKFVIPRTITEIQASATVVIAEQTQGGDSITASVDVDGKPVVAADAEQLRNAAEFQLDRETDEDGKPKTSLHEVVVEVGADNVAAGVVMLVYDKP